MVGSGGRLATDVVRPSRAQKVGIFEGFFIPDDLVQTGPGFVANLARRTLAMLRRILDQPVGRSWGRYDRLPCRSSDGWIARTHVAHEAYLLVCRRRTVPGTAIRFCHLAPVL